MKYNSVPLVRVFLSIVFFLAPASGLDKRENKFNSTNPAISQTETWGSGEVVSLSYSQNGERLAIGTFQGRILIHETGSYGVVQSIETGLRLGFDSGFPGAYAKTSAVALSPNGDLVAAVAVDDSIGLWRVDTGEKVFLKLGSEKGDYKHSSHAGEFVLLRFLGHGEVIDLQDGNATHHFFRTADGTELKVGSLPINSNFETATDETLGRVYATDGFGGAALRYNFRRTLDWLTWLDGDTAWKDPSKVRGFSTDLRYILKGAVSDQRLEVWDTKEAKSVLNITLEKWKELQPLSRGWDATGVFTPDNSKVIVFPVYGRGEVVVAKGYDIATGVEQSSWSFPAPLKVVAAADPQGKYIAYAVPGGFQITDIQSGVVQQNILFGTCAGNLSLSPDQTLIASYSSQIIYICQAYDGKLLQTIPSPTSSILDLAWSPDSKTIATSGRYAWDSSAYDNHVYLWDANTGQMISDFKGAEGEFGAITFSPDGQVLAGFNGFIRSCNLTKPGKEIIAWRLSDGEIINNISVLKRIAGGLAYTRDGSRLIAASHNYCEYGARPVWLVDPQRGLSTIVMEGDIPKFTVLENGNLAVFDSGKTQIWDITPEKPVQIASYDMNGFAISPDGTYLLVRTFEYGPNGSSGSRIISVRNLTTNTSETILNEKANHWYPEVSAVFTKDGRLLVSPLENAGQILTWKLP